MYNLLLLHDECDFLFDYSTDVSFNGHAQYNAYTLCAPIVFYTNGFSPRIRDVNEISPSTARGGPYTTIIRLQAVFGISFRVRSYFHRRFSSLYSVNVRCDPENCERTQF